MYACAHFYTYRIASIFSQSKIYFACLCKTVFLPCLPIVLLPLLCLSLVCFLLRFVVCTSLTRHLCTIHNYTTSHCQIVHSTSTSDRNSFSESSFLFCSMVPLTVNATTVNATKHYIGFGLQCVHRLTGLKYFFALRSPVYYCL